MHHLRTRALPCRSSSKKPRATSLPCRCRVPDRRSIPRGFRGRGERERSRLCGYRRAAHGGNAAVVAVRQFLQRRALRAPSGGLFLQCRCEGGRPMCFPRALARLRPSAVRVQIRSRSTSARPPRTASINRPVLVPVSAHGSAKDRNCAFASTMRLTMPNKSKGAAGEAVDACHRHHVAGGQLAEHLVKLAPVGAHARHLLAVDVPAAASRGAKLLKLAVNRLPVGADAGIADEPLFGWVSTITDDAYKPLKSWAQDFYRKS